MSEPRRISIEDWQLLSFFEVEPERPYPDLPWLYSRSIYVVERDGLALRFDIKPASRSLEMVLTPAEPAIQLPLFEFRTRSFADVVWRHDDDGDVENLEIVLTDRHSMWLWVRPRIRIMQDWRDVS